MKALSRETRLSFDCLHLGEALAWLSCTNKTYFLIEKPMNNLHMLIKTSMNSSTHKRNKISSDLSPGKDPWLATFSLGLYHGPENFWGPRRSPSILSARSVPFSPPQWS